MIFRYLKTILIECLWLSQPQRNENFTRLRLILTHLHEHKFAFNFQDWWYRNCFFFFFAFLFFVGFFVCLMFFFSLTIFIMNLINLEFLFVESDDPSLMTDLDTAYRNMMKVVDTNDADVSITFLLWSHLEIENLIQHWNK